MSNLAVELTIQCLDSKETYLDLGRCGLRDEDFENGGILDMLLGQCTHLETLILSNSWYDHDAHLFLVSENTAQRNELSKLPIALLKLRKLKQLICNGSSLNRYSITNLTPLRNLFHLTYLDLSHNSISELTTIPKLIQLQKLYLDSNEISAIPSLERLSTICEISLEKNTIIDVSGLKNLSSLKTLNLAHNNIDSVAELSGLNKLEVLDLRSNNLRSMSSFQVFNSLKILRLTSNQIIKISNYDKFPSLQRIRLDGNKIETITVEDFRFLTNLKNDSYSNFLDISYNPIISPPPEIFYRGDGAIKNYFLELEKQGIDYLFEAKMLIVGLPRSGKTSLRYKLFDIQKPLPIEEETTRGIDIEQLEFDIKDKEGISRKFKYNIWDFGGQHIYQSTHQFFLSNRSLYVLVIDTGKLNRK